MVKHFDNKQESFSSFQKRVFLLYVFFIIQLLQQGLKISLNCFEEA